MTEPLLYEDGLLRGKPDIQHIAAIQYQEVAGGWVPFSVTTVRPDSPNWCASTIDVDWCKRDECVYYHESGSGGDGLFLAEFVEKEPLTPIWFDSDLLTPYKWESTDHPRVPLGDNDLTALGYKRVDAPLKLRGGPSIHPFENGGNYDAQENQTVYCSICNDAYPNDQECQHLFWDDDIGLHLGPGSTEDTHIDKDKEEDYYPSLSAVWTLFERGDLRRFKEALERNSFEMRCGGSIHNSSWVTCWLYERQTVLTLSSWHDRPSYDELDKMERGLDWMQCLEKGTPQDNALTASWLNRFLWES